MARTLLGLICCFALAGEVATAQTADQTSTGKAADQIQLQPAPEPAPETFEPPATGSGGGMPPPTGVPQPSGEVDSRLAEICAKIPDYPACEGLDIGNRSQGN